MMSSLVSLKQLNGYCKVNAIIDCLAKRTSAGLLQAGEVWICYICSAAAAKLGFKLISACIA